MGGRVKEVAEAEAEAARHALDEKDASGRM
jgi:hypothetical protein